MDDKNKTFETLYERVEEYTHTTIELYKLKAIDKSSEALSSLAYQLIVIVLLTLFFLIVNIGIALWLGDLWGKSYLGFFTVSGFYALLALLAFVFRDRWIRKPLRKSIVSAWLED